jgi:hypothetical protein
VHGCVDASAAGFSSSFTLEDGSIFYWHGIWGRDADSVTSNSRKLHTLVESIEEGVLLGDLLQSELFVITDNTTAEGAYYCGNSDNRHLFQLILHLHNLKIQAS